MSELACLPHSVGHGHEGICIQFHLGPYRLLLDCGVENPAFLLDNEQVSPPVDFVFCSHAHSDHARGLLALRRRYPHLPIFASEVTAQLLPLNWLDDDVPADLCQALPWRTPVEIADGLTVQIWPAGHLPGAACLFFTYSSPERTYKLFYTGDFFLSNSRLVEGLPLEDLRGLRPDVLIVEGTHGNARNPHRRQQENRLADTLQRLLQQGHSVLLPTSTLGIGQELVMLLRSHHLFTGKDFTVWVDPVVAAGCDLYLDLMAYFPSSVQNFARHQPLFWDERILPRVRRIPTDGPFEPDGPCIVIGHRTDDLSRYCRSTDSPWTILFSEPFASGMAASALRKAAMAGDDDLTFDWLQALAPDLGSGRVQIETYLLTTHCDGTGTTQLIHNLRPQHVVFIHGEPHQLADLASLEELQNRYQLHLPSAGNWLELPLGETFIQPAAPDAVYEAEVTEAEGGVVILVSDTITTDPRWYRFADTGILQARWQGENLVLQSVSEQALLSEAALVSIPTQDCCQRCRHLRGQRCWNTFSPLYGLNVTPDGYCPAFETKPKAPPSLGSEEESA